MSEQDDSLAIPRLREFLHGDHYRYLPRFMRDFHDAKSLFKSVERHMGRDKDHYAVPWINGQCYAVDKFLKFMAMHGYTLQRCRRPLPFCKLDDTLAADERENVEAFRKMLDGARQDAAAARPAESEVRDGEP